MVLNFFGKKTNPRVDAENALQSAFNEAQKGNAGAMESFLSVAQTHADKAKLDITQRVSAIEDVGYRGALESALKSAAEYAELGQKDLMERFIRLAVGYASRLEMNVDNRLTSIRKQLKGKV